ncbi:type II toxin-antitoxin system RelE/ParE family toxin [Campylobacter concisus]|uniref:type II toxin-antitoxin system RelE/ParE family toxin n=1 Tax=Campylobacter concisus TaxID=199 RepID=UPI001F1F1FDC|nr:type II toxin-antitoxin system RelE/ParE family toxin [Campylobacter concisus]
MNKYKVLISPQAYEELEAIYKYIAMSLLSPGAANSTLEAIKNAILSLDEMPNRGAIRVVLLEKLADMPIWAIDSYLLKTIQLFIG